MTCLAEIRKKERDYRNVLRALEAHPQWTIDRIKARFRVSEAYIVRVANMNHLSLVRPSDGWIGRP